MRLICALSVALLLPLVLGGHGHAHDHGHGHAHGAEEAPSFKWSKAANTKDEDPTLEEEGIDMENIETITGHGHAHVHEHKHEDHEHGHAHGGHGHSHGGHGHSHSQQKEPTAEERAKHRANLHANWDDDDEHHEGGGSQSMATIWFNAMMATLLISAAPFFILFLIPLDKSAENQWLLKIMLAFASGGLLGDAFLHLIPHAMMAAQEPGGEGHGHSHSHGHSHGEGAEHGPHDMSVGLGVLAGVLAFLCVEKLVRIMKGGHAHSHNIKPVEKKEEDGKKKSTEEKKKKKAKDSDNEDTEETKEEKDSAKKVEKKKEVAVQEEEEDIKVAGYLNLAADCFHNFTDGLAVGASFLAGESIGMITTLTILFHEVPHEIGDFAILIQSGVPRNKAIMLQLLTAVGAITGCAVSLILGGATEAAASLTLPFTAGGFIYIATVHVIPELLEGASFKQSMMEVMAMLAGIGMMIIIAQYE